MKRDIVTDATGVRLYIDAHYAGRVDFEHFIGDHICLHYELNPVFHRQGLMSSLVDLVYSERDHDLIHWTDDPFYKIEHHRHGIMTPKGRLFADGYRLKRGITLPEYTFDQQYNYVPRR